MYNARIAHIRTYYQAWTTTPTLVEKTMSRAQLFKVENPLWAYGQAIYRIQEVQDLYERVKHNKQKKMNFINCLTIC